MHHLKSLALAAALASVATQSLAGGFAPVVVDPEPVVVVEPEAPRSTFGILLPLLLLGALVVIATQDDDDDGVCPDDEEYDPVTDECVPLSAG
jgi:hypothetical protein